MSNSNILLKASLSIFLLFIALSPLQAQETVDPQSGRLSVTAADLVVAAGPVNLEVRRILQPDRGESGLLGSRWRLNFEKRLIKENNRVRIEEERGAVFFTQEGNHREYKNDLAGRIRLETNGQAVWLKTDRTRETFDREGRLTEIDFRNFNRARLIYSPDKRLAGIEGPRKQTLKFASDPQGRIVRIESSTGDLITYQYTKEELAQVQVNEASPIGYHYDANGLLTRIENPRTGPVEMTYDAKGRVLSRRFADGRQEQHKYAGEGNEHETIDPAGGVTKRKSSADGYREEVTNPLGHKTFTEYNAPGFPVSLTDALGNKTQISYDSQSRIIGLKDDSGKTSRFEYLRETIFLSAVIDPDGTRQTFQYDGQMNLTEVRRGAQTFLLQTYYPDGGLKSCKEMGKPEERFTYDQAGRIATQGNALGQQTRFEYDPRGNLIRKTNPLGGVTTFKYDRNKRLISMTDPAKATTRYEHNLQGLLTKVIDPAGGVRSYGYDSRGRLLTMTDPSGGVIRNEYDPLGRIVKKLYPGGQANLFNYDSVGNLVSETNTLGQTSQYTYDPLGRVSKEITASGLEVTYGYDTQDHLISWKDSLGAGENLKYNIDGNLLERTNLQGTTTRFAYDSAGNLLSITDPLGKIKRFSYSRTGELTEVAEPDGSRARYSYDFAGRVSVITHPSGGETRYFYDPASNVISSMDPLGQTTKKSYDQAGRMLSQTDAKRQTTAFTYDVLGQLLEKQFPDKKKVLYRYNSMGNLVQADDGSSSIRRLYDQNNRLAQLEFPALNRLIRFQYETSGLFSKVIDLEDRPIVYEYDGAKRIKAIRLVNGKNFLFTYNANNQLTSLIYPNGVLSLWEYDLQGRLTSLTYKNQAGKTLTGWRYVYDASGNRVNITDAQDRSVKYSYDAAGRLEEEYRGPGDTTRYVYLAGGNRGQKQSAKETITYRYDRADRILQSGPETFGYDADGRITERKDPRGVSRYVYDSEGRLTNVIHPDKSEVAYGYSPTGERIWRRDQTGLTYFVTDGFNLLAELKEDLSVKASYLHAPGIDRPLIMTKEGKSYYFHPDPLGSIMALTDDMGIVVASYEYDPFGKIIDKQGTVETPFTFTARELDPATGLYYFRARYYDPGIGRFLSPDPLPPDWTDPLEFNPYLYARNNPLRFIDPFGTFSDAEQLWLAEKDAAWYQKLISNPNPGYEAMNAAEWQQRLSEKERLIAEMRSRGITPQRPPNWGPPSTTLSSSGSSGESLASGTGRGPRVSQTLNQPVAQRPPRTNPTIPVERPPSGLTPELEAAGSRLGRGVKWLGPKIVRGAVVLGTISDLIDIYQAGAEIRGGRDARAGEKDAKDKLDQQKDKVDQFVRDRLNVDLSPLLTLREEILKLKEKAEGKIEEIRKRNKTASAKADLLLKKIYDPVKDLCDDGEYADVTNLYGKANQKYGAEAAEELADYQAAGGLVQACKSTADADKALTLYNSAKTKAEKTRKDF